MSKFDDNHIEQLFKEAADKFEPAYNPNAWAKMQTKMVDQSKAVVFWNSNKIIISILLLVSILFAIYFFGSFQNGKANSDIVKSDINSDVLVENKVGKSLLKDSIRIDHTKENLIVNIDSNQANKKKPLILKPKLNNAINENATEHTGNTEVTLKSLNALNINESNSGDQLLNFNQTAFVESDKLRMDGVEIIDIQALISKSLTAKEFKRNRILMSSVKIDTTINELTETNIDYRKFAVSILFSPDFSGTKPANFKGNGLDIGLMLEYFINRKISLNAGAQYSRKKYFVDEGFEGYVARWPTRAVPNEIDASCSVIDIPINLRYYFFENSKTRMFFNSGITSYLMLTEDYLYRYDDSSTNDWAINVENENKHYFGILNFSFGLQKNIANGFYIVGEPFYKLPLQGIGAGDVNLHSSGIYISIKKDF